MICEGIDGAWIQSIDGKLTFYGALSECYDDCAKYWRKAETRRQYGRDYNDRILPNLEGHNCKPIEAYTKEDYDSVIRLIAEQGQSTSSETFIPYANSTLQHFRHLIKVVVTAAANHDLCNNVLWGTAFSVEDEYTPEDGIRENVKLKKSLTISQEWALSKALLSDAKQCGQNMGLLLMYVLGLRNGEACGANYGDIKPMRSHPECRVLWVYKSTISGTNILQSSGKTRNADRIIPIPPKLEKFLEERRAFLEEKIRCSPEEESPHTDDLPIACVGSSYCTRCAASHLTSACRELFKQINMEELQLAYIDAQLSGEAVPDLPREREATAYLLRRNFGTHLYILGLTEAEIEYVIGHDIDDAYETRNEFVNEEKLYAIKLKMDQRPILNDHGKTNKVFRVCEVPGCFTPTGSHDSSSYIIPLKAGVLKAHFTAKEPTDFMRIQQKLSPLPANEVRIYASAVTVTHLRAIDILKQYHALYLENSDCAH